MPLPSGGHQGCAQHMEKVIIGPISTVQLGTLEDSLFRGKEVRRSKKTGIRAQVSGPQNIWDSNEQKLDASVHRAIQGSAGLDLHSTPPPPDSC